MSLSIPDLVKGFRNVGLEHRDHILVHSSLSSLGWVEDGPNAVIDALIETVGNDGTVMFPTLTGCPNDSRTNPPVYDARYTRAWTGAIPQASIKKDNAIRSLHPTHSVTAFGNLAKWFTDTHECVKTPCGYGSPYDKLADIGGKIVLIGVGQSVNTSFHHAEELARVPYVLLDEPVDITIINMSGDEVKMHNTYLHRWGPKRDYDNLENQMIELGICRIGLVGNAEVRVMDAGLQRLFLLQKLLEDPLATLALCERANWQ